MRDFSAFFLMTPSDAGRYAVEVLHRFDPDEETDCVEIGDGNINYVFRVRSRRDGHSVIIKQADKLLRSSGRPLDIYRNKIEAAVLRLENELAPGYVPQVYHYDEVMAATAMEDVSAFGNLRRELAANRVYPHLAENLSAFLANTLLPSTDLVLDRAEKKRRAAFFTNPELCEITEDLVLMEPYHNFKGRNVISPGNEAFVREFLYGDEVLHTEVAKLRCNFMNNAQALLHGDLHTGSIFANEKGIRILDPEFAFYGPMGYDIGNVIGNLFFSWGNKAFTMPEETGVIAALQQTISDVCDQTMARLAAKYDQLVRFQLYRIEAFRRSYLEGVWRDSLGYAGTELIRRVVGDAKVAEVTSVPDPDRRIPLERALIKLGIALIKRRETLGNGEAVTAAFRLILS